MRVVQMTERVEDPTPAEMRDSGSTTETPSGVSRRGKATWLLIGGVSVVLLVLLILFGYGLIQANSFAGLGINAVGQVGRIPPGPAADFQVELFSGGRFHLADQRGKVVLVNFWASWCVPCRDEAPVLERVARDYRDRGVVVVGIDVWDGDQDARAFLSQYGISYPNGPDRSAITVEYGVAGVPETYFIRVDGTTARRWIGPLSDFEVHTFVDEVLR